MRIALAQFNPLVGDIDRNAERIIECIARARSEAADLVVTPELAVFGYPPKDLVLRRDLVERNERALSRIADVCRGITAVVGYVATDSSSAGKGILNAAGVCVDGRVVATYGKALLPTYDVFDESRYFNPGQEAVTCEIAARSGPVVIGLSICEDLWNDEQFEGRRVYSNDPIERTVRAGAKLLINLSASPYRSGVKELREALFVRQIRKHNVPLVYVNQVGGNDDLIFDGASLVLGCDGSVIARAKPFAEDFVIVDLPIGDETVRDEIVGSVNGVAPSTSIEPYPEPVDSVRMALVLGVRDYVRKCGFADVVIGLSGGIDSALTAALAVEALGSEHVHGVAMPSRFSSKHSVEDAAALATGLGVDHRSIPIEQVHAAMEATIIPHFADLAPDITEENIQARVRGNILMALSNKFGWLLLTTGNKSELAVGYCTLYGDMCGGLAVLSDVPKTLVYALARRINETAGRPVIPVRTIDKAPSAELRKDQTDQDTLPPYDVLDGILERYVEYDDSIEAIVAAGFDRVTVECVTGMVDRNEHKRKQSPIGIKVTSRAFGTGRRMPIAARFR